MARPIGDLIQIVRTGAGIGIDASAYSQDRLVQLVNNVSVKARVTLRNLKSRPLIALVQLSASSGRKIV